MTRGVERADEMRRSRRSFLAGNRAKRQSAEVRRGAIAPCDKAPDQKDDDGPYDRTYQHRAVPARIPADRLLDIGGDERPDDPQDGGQDKSRRFIRAGVQKLGDDTRDEPDDDS